MARTPDDFVRDMIKKKLPWWQILSVARCVRGGSWYDKVREILQAKGIMPKSSEEVNTVFKKVWDEYKQAQDERNAARLGNPKKGQ